MLSFKTEVGRFNYRTAAIIIDEQRILIHRGEEDPFWSLPGGRVEFGESADQALLRELEEELSIQVKNPRLLWVAENFFTYRGLKHHELSFYFLVTLPADAPINRGRQPFLGNEDQYKMIFQWYPLAQIKDITLLPSFIPDRLGELNNPIEYIVHRSQTD